MNTKRFLIMSTQRNSNAFTLAELLISFGIIVILVLMATQLLNTAMGITRTGDKHISTDTEARTVLDRMAVDIRQMLKRTDTDYYIKGPVNYTGHGNGHSWGRRVQTGQQGSDQIAFFTQVPGYTGSAAQGAGSPLSLVAYRVNANNGGASYLRLERMGKRLIWNSPPSGGNSPNRPLPIFFLPLTISAMVPDAVNPSGDGLSVYEVIGPNVFRFEYYYLLKTGKLTDIPWNTDPVAGTAHTSMAGIGLGDVQAIGVAIAVVDPAGRALINSAGATSLFDLASDLADFRTAPGRGVGGAKNFGDLEYLWNQTVITETANGQTSAGSLLPPAAAKAIQIYSRTFDLRTL